jgi:phage tail-like protein
MAKYQRGMVVKAKASARSVDVYTRRMSQGARTTSVSVKPGTRGRTSEARVTATSVAAMTRSMTVAAKTTATSVKPFTRSMKVKAKVTARSVKIYTRHIEKREIERPATTPGARGMKQPDEIVDRDPWGNYRFALFIDDKEIAHFMECSGLKNSAEVFEIQEGGLNGRTHKRTGQSKWENITLRYGTSASNELLKWRDDFLQDKFTDGLRIDPKKASGAIVLMANSGDVLRRYEFTNAWPVSWEGPSLTSGGSALSLETLELAHDGLTITEGSE